MSTLEACARFLSEAAATLNIEPAEARRLLRGLDPLLAYVRARRDGAGCDGDDHPPSPDSQPHSQLLSEWLPALEAAARAAPPLSLPPVGLRWCCVCSVGVSTPLRMQAHIQ